MTLARALLACLIVALLPAAAAIAHPAGPAAPDGTYQWGEQNSPTFSAAMQNVADPRMAKGPCTDYAKRTMPAGEGHDHTDIAQHRFACNMRQVAFESLTEQLGARPDVRLGEMDSRATSRSSRSPTPSRASCCSTSRTPRTPSS